MDFKPLLFGLIGFFLGGLLVSVAATTFEKPAASDAQTQRSAHGELQMSQMVQELRGLSGDEYDKAFIRHMIEHHESAVDMARLSAERAKHDEIKQLSEAVIEAQQSEIERMRQWQHDWGYGSEAQH